MSVLSRISRWLDQSDHTAVAKPAGTRLRMESLEAREVLTLGLPFVADAPTFGTPTSGEVANATSQNGMSVVVWTASTFANGTDIRARLFAADGTPGKVIQATGGSSDQRDPAVGMDANGNFVIAYTQVINGQSSVIARRMDNTGKILGDTVVATFASTDADVAVDAAGNFVVSYTFDFNGDRNVHVRRYNAAGVFLGQSDAANSSLFDEYKSSVALAPNGGFVVAFERGDLSNSNVTDNVLLSRFDSQGKPLASNATVLVAFSSLNERDPDVGVDGFGNAVVAFERVNADGTTQVLAQRVTSFGTLGGLVPVSDPALTRTATDPVIAVNRFGGGTFVVAYDNRTHTSQDGIEVAEVAGFSNAVTARIGGFSSIDDSPAISMGDQGDYFVTYNRFGVDGIDVMGRRGVRK